MTDTPGCLLIHGYGGSPFEMEPLADPLRAAGFAVRLVCLPGHGDDARPFTSTRFDDWLDCVEKAYQDMAAQHSRMLLAGFSMGGTLALALAARYQRLGVVCISTPVHVLNLFPWPLRNLRLYAASVCSRITRLLQSGTERAQADEQEAARQALSRTMAPWQGHKGPLCFPQLLSLRRGCAAVLRDLPLVTAPLLLLHDRRDKLVYVGNAWEIAGRVASPLVRLRLTGIAEEITSHHMLTTHQETRALVIDAVTVFARDLLG